MAAPGDCFWVVRSRGAGGRAVALVRVASARRFNLGVKVRELLVCLHRELGQTALQDHLSQALERDRHSTGLETEGEEVVLGQVWEVVAGFIEGQESFAET